MSDPNLRDLKLMALILFYVDIDECGQRRHTCDAMASCSNTIGSFACTCNIGYQGDGFMCSGMYCQLFIIIIFSFVALFFYFNDSNDSKGKSGAVDRASDYEYMHNDCPAWVRARLVPKFAWASCAPEQGTLL